MHLFRLLFLAILMSSVSSVSYAENDEHIVILWDVTGSLLPQEKGLKDYDGSQLPTYSQGNGLWMELKKSIIDCIEYADEDPSNKITIIPFNDNPTAPYTRQATSAGKDDLINYVKGYRYKSHKNTNIVAPIKQFYNLLRGNEIKYMFLFTDGEHDHAQTKNNFIPTLDSWTNMTKNQKAYGFYVLVHPAADKPEIRRSVENQDNFWIVADARVRIKICSLPETLKFNLRDDKAPKTIKIEGRYTGATGDVALIPNNNNYDIVCSESSIINGKIKFEVKPKNGFTPPQQDTIHLTPQISNADNYTFIGPKQILLFVSNLPERSLGIEVNNTDFGVASYHKPFLWTKEGYTQAVNNIKISFSEQAKHENSSAIIKVYLVDKNGENKIPIDSQCLKFYIDGKKYNGDSFKLTSNMTNIKLSIEGMPETRSGKYYGRIEIIPNNLDNWEINGAQEILKWNVKFEQRWNPLQLLIILILFAVFVIFLLAKIILRMRNPRFGSIQKNLIVPGMAPIIIKFKGARQVVIAANHPKKQSQWNRFWTGKIVYVTHPTFVSPITLKPSRGKAILARTQAGAYQIQPNPIPGVGAATITVTNTRMRINVN